MGRNRGVDPNDTVTLTLPDSDGDWIEVRRRLTSGQERMIQRMTAKGYQRADASGGDAQIRVDLDVTKFAIVRAAQYITNWNLKNFQGKPIVLPANFTLEKRIEIIEGLDEDTVQEIDEAISAHIAAQQEARESEKKARGGGSGETASAQTSPSAVS
jgi:hypothetical protein